MDLGAITLHSSWNLATLEGKEPRAEGEEESHSFDGQLEPENGEG